MFKQLGQLFSLLQNRDKLREEMEALRGRLAQITAEGDAGGGMVKAKVNGHLEVQSCVISDEGMKLQDRELLEDLIVAAINQALQKVRQLVAEETGKMASNLGLPPGMSLPGMSS